MNNDSLGDRMKGYENISRTYLTRRIPVIIRVDGKAFHTFTKGMKKPFDHILMQTMQATMMGLCSNIQGCVFGYTQSDEITLVLTDYNKITTNGWFDYNIQKMSSISASMSTLIFNRELVKRVGTIGELYAEAWHTSEEEDKYMATLEKAIERGAMFDSRVFTIPKEEVCNCLIWRQQDATRNSIESAGRAYYTDKELFKVNCSGIQDLLHQKGINWNDYPVAFKRGSACYRELCEAKIPNPTNSSETLTVMRNKWKLDTEIPVFTQDRDFVEKHLIPKEE